mgnify:CR=1 FL=1
MKYLKSKNIIILSSLFFLPKLVFASTVENAAAGGVVALIVGAMFSFWFLWMMIVGLMMIINILGIALWIWMIIDVAQREFEKENDKMLWVLVVVLAGWIGALIYYFTIKRKDQEDKKIN